MLRILEETLTTYRQEWDSLLLVSSPALVLGPVAGLFISSGVLAAVVGLPTFLLLCAVVYAACMRAEVLILSNLAPDPGDAYLSVLGRARDVFHAAVPSVVALAALSGAVLAVLRFAGPFLGFLACVAGALCFLWWVSRHAYDEPLVIVRALPAKEALSVGAGLARGYGSWNLALVATLSSPLLLAVFLSWVAAVIFGPAVGGATFCLGIALWLPFFAVGITIACAQVAGAEE